MNLIFIAALVVIMLSEASEKEDCKWNTFPDHETPVWGIRRDWALRWTRLFVILKIVNCF